MKNIALLLFAAITSSVLMTAASPGYDQWYAAYFALAPMLIAIPLTGFGFLTGWLYGTLYFLLNIHWVVNAVSDFGNSPFFVGVLVAAAFSMGLGLFWGVFGYLYKKKHKAGFLMAGVVVALEVARSTLLTGFPMLNLSHTQYTFLPAIQIAEVAGSYGISLIIAYMNLSIASLITNKNKQSILFALLLTAASIIYGFSVQGRTYAGTDINVSIIQPAYSQADKWIPEKKYDIMSDVNTMLRAVDLEKHDMVILPETVYPAFLNPSFAGYHMLSIAGEKVPVIAGGIRFIENDGKRIYKNSVFMFDGENVSTYDKIHLVPFGEYFPLKNIFKPIDYYFFKGAEDFAPGDGASVFVNEKFTAAPMVCYESMYSDLVRDQVMLGADVVTVVTNDSWFGDSKGPYQHLATDVLRAVEFRKPVLRAAQSGISACITPSGEVTDALGTGVKGTLECSVTTHKGLTLFATGGYGWLAVFLFAAWYFSRRKGL
jgi:apolipoprotein N-acyltransferase